jgi:membrane associated rhomboid family serine protease
MTVVEDHLRQASDRRAGRLWDSTWPICTIMILAITTLLTVLQFRIPGVRLALWRDPAQIHAGQWWRLLTALFVQYDRVWQIFTVLVLVAAIGVFAERLYGHLNWLLIYLSCGVIGQALGLLWMPHTSDAGCSVAAPDCSVRYVPGCCPRQHRASREFGYGQWCGWWWESSLRPKAICTVRRC